MRLVGIRGAIVAKDNSPEAITDATVKMLRSLLSKNRLSASNIVSVFFTMTPDLNAIFPATAARKVCGLDVPLLCATEIPVPNSLKKVIRVLVHAYLPRKRGKIVHTYIGEAKRLRPDFSPVRRRKYTDGGKE